MQLPLAGLGLEQPADGGSGGWGGHERRLPEGRLILVRLVLQGNLTPASANNALPSGLS